MGLVRHSDEAAPGGGPADTHRSLVPRQRLQPHGSHSNLPFQPSGLPFPAVCRYTRRLSKVRQRVLPAMEINPILNSIKDLSERSETIRGYL